VPTSISTGIGVGLLLTLIADLIRTVS
jgi:hypothetical protein